MFFSTVFLKYIDFDKLKTFLIYFKNTIEGQH